MTTSIASTQKYYVGDTGTLVLVDTLTDLSAATSVKLVVKKPGGTIVEWTGSVYHTTIIKYITLVTDFSVAGTYYLQAKVTLPSGVWLGNTTTFVVTGVFL